MLSLPSVLAGAYQGHARRLALRSLNIIALALILFIGLRHLVGCDWYSYEEIYYRILRLGPVAGSGGAEPGYVLSNWISAKLGWDIYGANFFCAAVFVFGLMQFARRQPLPHLFLIAAFPLLVVTVAMGYTRQGASIGLLMMAFNAFADRRMLRYLAFVGAAMLFHSTAIIFTPAAIFLTKRKMTLPALMVIFAVGTIAAYLLEDRIRALIELYIVGDTFESTGSGAIFRVGLNGVAAVLFFLLHKRWCRMFSDHHLYAIVLTLSFASFAAILISPVAADRLALYLLPLQAGVLARLPLLLGGRRGVAPLVLVIIGVSAALMWFWFRFATNSVCWVPYRSIIMPGSS